MLVAWSSSFCGFSASWSPAKLRGKVSSSPGAGCNTAHARNLERGLKLALGINPRLLAWNT
eukprot:11162907-Lingulodinium_polyedra.AAC.1